MPTSGPIPTDKLGPRSARDTARVPRSGDKARDTARNLLLGRNWRVCMFAPGLELSGVTTATLNLMHALGETGSKVALCSPTGALIEAATACCTRWIEAVPRPGLFARRRFRQVLDEFAPQVLHAVAPLGVPAAFAAAAYTGLPLLASVFGVKRHELPAPGEKRIAGYIASDQAVRERLRNDCNVGADQVSLLPPCAFPSRAPVEHEIMNPRRQPVVGFVSPLTSPAGWREFLDAALRVMSGGADCMFAILGDGPQSPRVRELVEERGMQQRVVQVAHMFDYGRIWEPFDIIVIDSRQPAAATMVMQAMAGGHPVVATEGGSVFGVIEDGQDGLIAPRNNPEALAQRLLFLMQNPAERLRLARAAFERIEETCEESWVAGALSAIYAAALAGEPLPKSFEGMKAAKR